MRQAVGFGFQELKEALTFNCQSLSIQMVKRKCFKTWSSKTHEISKSPFFLVNLLLLTETQLFLVTTLTKTRPGSTATARAPRSGRRPRPRPRSNACERKSPSAGGVTLSAGAENRNKKSWRMLVGGEKPSEKTMWVGKNWWILIVFFFFF